MRRVLILAAVLALGVLVWWGSTEGGGGAPARPAAPALGDDAPEVRGAPALDGRSPPQSPVADGEAGRRPDDEPGPPEDAYAIHGHVRDARTGDPVGNVPVFVLPARWGLHSFRIMTRTRSAADGSYRVADLRAGDADPWVVALGDGWISAAIAEVSALSPEAMPKAEAVAGASFAFDVFVVPAARVRGQVIRPDGTPVPGARVRGRQRVVTPGVTMVRTFTPEDLLPAVTTDPAGRFAFDAVPAAEGLVLEVNAPGCPWTRSAPIATRLGAVAEVTLTLARGRTADLHVVDDQGASVVGALVTVRRMRTHDPDHDGFVDPNDVVDARTDARGRLALSGLPRVPLWIAVRAPGHARWRSDEGADALAAVARPRGDDPDTWTGRIALVRLGLVTGRIRLPDGSAPGPEDWVSVRTEGLDAGSQGLPPPDAAVDPDGTFRVTVPRVGRVRVTAHVQGDEASWTGGSEVAAGDRGVALTLTREAVDEEDPWRAEPLDGPSEPPTDARWWAVEAVGPDGRPLRSSLALLEVSLRETDFFGGDIGEPRWFVRDGSSFRFAVPPGTLGVYLVLRRVVLADGGVGAPLVAGPFDGRGGRRTIRLAPAETIQGIVLDLDGRPLQGQQVVAVSGTPVEPPVEHDFLFSPPTSVARSDAHGRFTLRALAGGIHTLWLRPRPGLVPAAPIRAHAGTADAVLRLKPPTSALVRVIDAAGRPVGGAILRAAPVEEGPWTGRDARVVVGRTDRDGRCPLHGLDGAAPYVLTVDPPREQGDFGGARIEPWMPGDREVVLRASER